MANEVTPPQTNAKPTTKSNVPVADVDFGKVATDVAKKWTDTAAITLIWTTAPEFTANAAAYNVELSKRKQVGGTRPQITQALSELDNQIDDGMSYVKGYIIDKYKKESGASYFPAFGIIHKSNKYIIPTDRNSRSAAMTMMLEALIVNGFDTKEYGTAFWTPIKTQYDTLLGQATTTDGTVSTKVSSKNTLKALLKKSMNCLIYVLQGNYPDTYKAELRAWGFQKEKY
jgi:hypothetical protein